MIERHAIARGVSIQVPLRAFFILSPPPAIYFVKKNNHCVFFVIPLHRPVPKGGCMYPMIPLGKTDSHDSVLLLRSPASIHHTFCLEYLMSEIGLMV